MTLILGAVITAIVGPMVLAWFTRRDLKRRVGTPNGQGNLVEMVERIDKNQDSLTILLADHTIQDARQFEELKRQIDTIGAVASNSNVTVRVEGTPTP